MKIRCWRCWWRGRRTWATTAHDGHAYCDDCLAHLAQAADEQQRAAYHAGASWGIYR